MSKENVPYKIKNYGIGAYLGPYDFLNFCREPVRDYKCINSYVMKDCNV